MHGYAAYSVQTDGGNSLLIHTLPYVTSILNRSQCLPICAMETHVDCRTVVATSPMWDPISTERFAIGHSFAMWRPLFTFHYYRTEMHSSLHTAMHSTPSTHTLAHAAQVMAWTIAQEGSASTLMDMETDVDGTTKWSGAMPKPLPNISIFWLRKDLLFRRGPALGAAQSKEGKRMIREM